MMGTDATHRLNGGSLNTANFSMDKVRGILQSEMALRAKNITLCPGRNIYWFSLLFPYWEDNQNDPQRPD